jgi:hypothetical protein
MVSVKRSKGENPDPLYKNFIGCQLFLTVFLSCRMIKWLKKGALMDAWYIGVVMALFGVSWLFVKLLERI